MKCTIEINRKRALRGLGPIEQYLHKFQPSDKMRVLGPSSLKSFTRRFVINQINIEDSHAKV